MSEIMTGQRKLTQKTSTPVKEHGEKDGDLTEHERTQGTAPNAPDLVLSSWFAGCHLFVASLLGKEHKF